MSSIRPHSTFRRSAAQKRHGRPASSWTMHADLQEASWTTTSPRRIKSLLRPATRAPFRGVRRAAHCRHLRSEASEAKIIQHGTGQFESAQPQPARMDQSPGEQAGKKINRCRQAYASNGKLQLLLLLICCLHASSARSSCMHSEVSTSWALMMWLFNSPSLTASGRSMPLPSSSSSAGRV